MPPAAPPRPGVRDTRIEALAERLYFAHRPRLLAIARRNSDGEEEAEEALQDAFIAFIEHFDPCSEAPPLAWLILTLKRRCWALYRERRRKFNRVDPDCASQLDVEPGELGASYRLAAELAEVTEETETLLGQLAALKRDERQALGLLALGYSYREICEITGWTYTKVNRCLVEGRTRLRQMAAT
jgi:RNA polymerase sigma factor (sigma-70 family)